MNPENTANIIESLIGEMLAVLIPTSRYVALAEASHAVDAGTATDEQLALVTNIIHNVFDAHDGCMVATLRDMIANKAPHYFVNHVIRTYVRKCDMREGS